MAFLNLTLPLEFAHSHPPAAWPPAAITATDKFNFLKLHSFTFPNEFLK